MGIDDVNENQPIPNQIKEKRSFDDTITRPRPSVETFAKPKISKAYGEGLVQKKMKDMKPKDKGNNDSPRDNKKRGGGPRLPPRLERIIQSEIDDDDPAPPILTELLELLVSYSVALLAHTAEKEGMRSESKSSSLGAAKAHASTAAMKGDGAGAGSEVEPPPSREYGSKERANRFVAKENAYQAEQCQRLQRCAHLYAQLLFQNTEWDCNLSEDQSIFEKLYAFIVKVVLSCVKDRMESGEVRSKNGGQTTARPQSIVEEELGRLFRSSIFNTRARRRERNHQIKFREEGTDEDKRFQIDDSGGKGGKDKELNQSGSTKGASSIDAIIARFRQRATSRRSRPSKVGKEGMQYAASARSPMIAALLPSPREKILEVHAFRCHQMGFTPRKGQVSDMAMFRVASPESPRRSPKMKDAQPATEPFENTWALRSGRSRIIHDRRTWATTGRPISPTNTN